MTRTAISILIANSIWRIRASRSISASKSSCASTTPPFMNLTSGSQAMGKIYTYIYIYILHHIILHNMGYLGMKCPYSLLATSKEFRLRIG